MEFVEITQDHLDGIANLYVRVFNAPPWGDGWTLSTATARLERCLANPDAFGLVGLNESQPVAFVIGYLERWVNGEHFHLKEMCVASDLQRTGIGATLLNTLSERLGPKGVSSIYLETRPQSGAASFYEKQGFRILNLQSMARREPPA